MDEKQEEIDMVEHYLKVINLQNEIIRYQAKMISQLEHF